MQPLTIASIGRRLWQRTTFTDRRCGLLSLLETHCMHVCTAHCGSLHPALTHSIGRCSAPLRWMRNTSTPSAKSSPPCRILLINTSPLFSKRIEVPYSSINEVSCTQEAQCAQLQDVLCRQLLQHQFDQVRSHVPLLDWMAGLLQVRVAPRAFGLWGDAVVFLKVRLCEVCTVHFCGWIALAMDCC